MQPRKMRGWSALAAAVMIAASVFSAPAPAQDAYPEKPIRLIVPFPPGGGTDIISRLLADKIATHNPGWKIVVENKPGAGGVIGLDAIAKSRADGYTIGMGQTSNLSIASSLNSNLSYNPLQDLTPISLVDASPIVIAVGVNSPLKSLSELIDDAKANPGKSLFASPGIGTVAHLALEYLQKVAQVKFAHVPYKGTSQALPDIISGRVTFYAASLESILPQVKAGQMRAIALTSQKRAAALPDVPTVSESGYAMEATSWFGMVAPAGAPEAVVATLSREIKKALASPDIKARFGGELETGAEAFDKLIRADHDKWEKVIKDANIKVQ